jgi:ATP-binding cassette, subfamily A (ABC1), member 3
LLLSKLKHALRGVSLGIRKGERFGLLGMNGAGKSTLLNILTADQQPSSGSVQIQDLDLTDPRAMRLIGYCPQIDPLFDLMTGREILSFYGRIRGISADLLASRIDHLIEQIGLAAFADRLCGRYSGGNKRKLSLGIALIGDPQVLLLDEPSTGMDPESRRKMWTVIEEVSASRSVVLVSHSMEECEALCTRIR